jgi:hypothetical protein
LQVNTTDRNGNPLRTLEGKDKTSVFFAVAFAKTPGVTEWWNEPHPMWRQIYDFARQSFPQDFDPQTGLCRLKNFAYKIMDGDGYDDDGKHNASKPGMAGHWIMKFASSYPARVTHGNTYITDPAAVKNGWFYRVLFDVKPNDGPKHGLYINPLGVELVGAGEEISSGIDAISRFAEAGAAALPVGAVALPVGFGGQAATAPNMRPVAPPMAAPAAMSPPGGVMHPPAALAQPVAMAPAPVAAPLAAPVPNHAFVANAGMAAPGAPLQAPAPLAAPPAAAPVYGAGPNSQCHAPDAWLGMGHSAEALIAGGQIVRVS